ncbi:hypothetical protein BsWGS_26680 [Bradybaena similaris]
MAENHGNCVNIEFNTIELPPSVEIKESSIFSGEAGAFSKTGIPKDTKFGPYKGEIINAGQKDYIDYRYAWEVFEKDSNELRFTISALDSKSSNWMRHVNCARFYEEQNILSIQEEFSIFYVAMKNIKPGEELLTWFDPKLLKRTKRRLSKMGRKPVGYTIELVPWSDEKKFVPEIIDTKRKRKKKVLSDMISLDENPLVITRTLQSLAKIPCTPKQLAQTSFKGTSVNTSLKTSRAVSPSTAPLMSKVKKGSRPASQNMINVSHKTENKVNENDFRSNAETSKQLQEGTDKFKCASLERVQTVDAVQIEAKRVACSDGVVVKVAEKKVNKNMLLKKTPIKLARARLQFATPRELFNMSTAAVKPVVVKQNEDGSTSVEDHDETYVLSNMELRPECDDQCPCLASNTCVKSNSSVKDKQNSFVIHFVLLPEHKILSPNNKTIYRCDVCDSAYNHAFSLKRHYLSVHVNHRYLSRDDILSCQIETFHMDMNVNAEHSEIGAETLLKDGESSAVQVQSTVPAVTDAPSGGDAEVSAHCPDKSGESGVEKCEDNDKENINETIEVPVTPQPTNVPSLKHLIEVSLCKTRGATDASCSAVSLQKLSITCDEVMSDSGVTGGCVSSADDESLSFNLPCLPDSGIDSVISKQSEGISICDVSQESPCVHNDIKEPGSDMLEVFTGQEDNEYEADQMTAKNVQTSEIIIDFNLNRHEQYDNNNEINSCLHREIAVDIMESTHVIKKSECEIQSDSSELDDGLLVKTVTDDLRWCASEEVCEEDNIEECRDVCHSHLNKVLTNHDEVSSDSTAALDRITTVYTVVHCSEETETTHCIEPTETISTSSVSDLLNMESDSVEVPGVGNPGEMIPPKSILLDVTDYSQCLDNSSAIAPSRLTILSEEDQAGMSDMSQVTDIPAGMSDVSQVTEIPAWMSDISPVTDTPAEMCDVSDSQVIEIPAWMSDVSPVTDTPAEMSDMSHSQVIEIPALMSDVSQVTDIPTGMSDVSQVTDVPPEMGDISQVTDIPAGMSDMSQVTDIPAGMSDMSQVTDMTAEISDVSPVTDTPAEMSDVSHSQVIEIPAWMSDVSQVTDIPAGMSDMSQVTDTPAGMSDVSSVPDIPAVMSDVSQVTDTPAEISDVSPVPNIPAGISDVSPVTDINKAVGLCGFASPMENGVSVSSGKPKASEPIQPACVLTSSIQTQQKQEPLDGQIPENYTVQTTVESSSVTTTTTSTSIIQNPSAQKLIFVTNLVFPVVSPSHKQPQNSSSSSQGSSLLPKTSQSASVPLVVISQVPCGLNMQNAAGAFLPNSNALKALQTMKSPFSVLNFGNSSSRLSLSVLPSGNKSSVSPSVCDKLLLENSLQLGMSASSTTAAPPSSSHSLSEQTTEKPLKPGLNLCAPFTAISSLVLGGQHIPASTTGSTKCTTSPAVVPLSSISSLISVSNNVTFVDGQPDDLYRCHMCVRVFKTMNELKFHIRNDPHRFKGGLKQYACQQCSMRFSNKNNLMRHNLMNHPESENYKFRCYTCGKGFMCETYLKMHARFHSGRNFPCKYGCKDMYFPNAASLVKHLRTQHPGLNLKEYLRNAKASKAHGRKLGCLLRTTVEQNTSLTTDGHTLGTSQSAVPTTFPYSLQQPGVGFQAKRRSKSSKATNGEDTKMTDQECELMPVTEESLPGMDDSCRLRYVCNLCQKRFRSHLKLLQHRTQQHGASESVQEYLYKMSKEVVDEEVSDTEAVKLKFSPPPSPTTFFENVNKRGFENMNHYIDGNKESLKYWQKHLNLQENTDPVLVSGVVRKLQLTTFNFPPCFEYREDCTTFYDSTTKPGTSPKLLANPTEDHKEMDICQVHHGLGVNSGTEDATVDAVKQEIIESCLQGAAKSILHFGDESCSTNVDSCLDVHEQGPVSASESQDHVCKSDHGLELNKNASNVARADNCVTVSGAEKIMGQTQSCSLVDLVTESQEVDESDTLSEELKAEGEVFEDTISATFDSSITNKKVETEGHYICRHIVEELVDRVVLVQESTMDEKYNSHRPDSILDGNSNLKECSCEGAESAPAADGCESLPNIDVKVEIKQETITEHVQEVNLTSNEPLTMADIILHRLPELSVQAKLDLFKSKSVQGLNLALSEHNHGLFLQKGHMPGNKSVLHSKLHCSQSLISALDLHITSGWMSSEMLDQVAGGGLKQALSLMKTKAMSLESLVSWPPNKHSGRHFEHGLDTSLTTSDTSRHDHRRYSIWAGQVHQKFDNTNKRDMFCQPVTEAVRKQEVMREKAQYVFEKSIRDDEMRVKDEKVTQKTCFAESLGLMSRNEFELSYHARKQQQFVIKVPDVWNNYENIWFGKKGNITVVCSICHRHFSCWDLCLRHQLKKHPHIEPASLEMERDNYVEDMYYYYPMPYGILAQTHLIPDNLPVPEVYVCVRCGFPFKNLNRLHAHMIICDPAQEEAISSRTSGVKKESYMKKKLLPMMDRRLHQQVEQPKPKISKSKSCVDVSVASPETKNNRSLLVSGKLGKPTLHASYNKLVTPAVQNRSSFSAPFSFYSGKKGKSYELLYNPQNHTRRREMYKILDQHQCHGCNLKFNSLSMLERHVNKCSGKDKLQNQKPLLSGIMPDDAALRKQHTCRYCGKRFTYIKGVDLHYKRICGIRKVKEEENQLTEEDLAHEAELKKILEHIKWSKSLSQDSSDIIQGHVRVEEDGSLTRVNKNRDCSQSLKKKVKKKGSKWTTLKRHRPEDDLPSASSVSCSTQSSPVMATENMKSVADEKVADKTDTVEVVGVKRLTRSAGHEGLYQNSEISNMRRTSAERGTGGKKAKTASKPALITNSCSKSSSPDSQLTQNKTDGNCYSTRKNPKKFTYNELINGSESRQSKTSKDTVKSSRSSPGTRNKSANSTVSTTANVTVCSKPPARKRARPKRFDPSDMESSYKKKKKDEDIILDQAKSDSNGKKRSTAGETKEKAITTAKGGDACQSSHVLRKTSSRSSTDSSATTPTSKVNVNKSGVSNERKVSVHKNVVSNKDESKLFEKMKKLKEAAKSESRKSDQKRKLPISLFTNYASKKSNSDDKIEKKCDKTLSKVVSSSELFKHLTTSEKVLQGSSPQKTVSNRKRPASMDSTGDVKNSQVSGKCLKITTQTSRCKSPAKTALSITSNATESPNSKFNKAAQKYQNNSEDKYKESDHEAPIVRTSAVSSTKPVSPDSKGTLPKPTSPVSKQPTVTFKVVTLSPNGSNLLTYDSSADVPRSSLLLAKPGKVTSHSLPAQQILKCLPQRPIQFVTKSSSLLQGTELQKTKNEQSIKVISAENLGLGVVRDAHKQAISTLVISEGDNIRINKPISQVCNQGLVFQKDLLYKTSCSPGKQDTNEMPHPLKDSEKQISHNVGSNSQDKNYIQRVVDNFFRDNQLSGDICDDQMILSSNESSLINSADQIVPKQSLGHDLQKSLKINSTQLSYADQLFKKQSDINMADENQSTGRNQVAVSSISSVLTLTEAQSQCQKQQTSGEECQLVQSASQSHPKSSTVEPNKSSSIPALHLTNPLSPMNSHESLSAIIVPSMSVKAHVTVPQAASTSTATRFTFPSRFRSPAKVVTVTGTVLPQLSQGNSGTTATRILKIGGVNIKNSCVPPTQAQTPNITAHYKQIPNTTRLLPQIVTQKPLVLNAGQLPRVLTAGARQQCPNTQQITPGALRQTVLNISANQTNCATQILPRRCLPKTVSQQICIAQSSLVKNIVTVAQPLSLANAGGSVPVSSLKPQTASNISLTPTLALPSASSQIMFSLDDGTTAMLDPDSLAQFLTVSPSLNKSELYSAASLPNAVQEYKNPLVLNVAGNQQNHQTVEEINWPANGTVDLTDMPDTMID